MDRQPSIRPEGSAEESKPSSRWRRYTSAVDKHMRDEFMEAAIEEAEQGVREGGIPIGSVLVHRGRIIGRGHNRRVQQGSAIRHGEMDALENAGRQTASVYRESVIYTTLSPCAMCSGAILLYGIPRVVVGENQTFLGEESLLGSRGVSVDVVQDPRCVRLMTTFIQANPGLWNEDIGA
jgi:cytosine/creatinine deaminase